MNRKLYIPILFVFFVTNAFSQSDFYYWSSNKKIQLTIDSSIFILLTRNINETESLLSNVDGVKSRKILSSDFIIVELEKEKLNQVH